MTMNQTIPFDLIDVDAETPAVDPGVDTEVAVFQAEEDVNPDVA